MPSAVSGIHSVHGGQGLRGRIYITEDCQVADLKKTALPMSKRRESRLMTTRLWMGLYLAMVEPSCPSYVN
jgi:hypothetical protein